MSSMFKSYISDNSNKCFDFINLQGSYRRRRCHRNERRRWLRELWDRSNRWSHSSSPPRRICRRSGQTRWHHHARLVFQFLHGIQFQVGVCKTRGEKTAQHCCSRRFIISKVYEVKSEVAIDTVNINNFSRMRKQPGLMYYEWDGI